MRHRIARARRTRWITAIVMTLGALAATACGDDDSTNPPDDNTIAGTYVATTFIVTQDGVPTDELERGAAIELTLNDDSTTAGTLFVPGGNEDGTDLVADLTGTWSLDGNTVHFAFAQASDTFIGDVPFTARGGTLATDRTILGVRVQVVLEKSQVVS